MSVKFDFSKLRGKIVEKYGSQRAFAGAINQSCNTLSRKMHNKMQFSSDDIVSISELLEIPGEEIGAYFFAERV